MKRSGKINKFSLKERLQNFVDWTKKKINHDIGENKKEIYFREKEIWWVALGQNIGSEMDGKHEFFSRPVLILKKYSGSMCFVLPLTTKIKKDSPSYQYTFELNSKLNAINLSQGRTISIKRLMQKEGNLSKEIFDSIFEKFVELLRK